MTFMHLFVCILIIIYIIDTLSSALTTVLKSMDCYKNHLLEEKNAILLSLFIYI